MRKIAGLLAAAAVALAMAPPPVSLVCAPDLREVCAIVGQVVCRIPKQPCLY